MRREKLDATQAEFALMTGVSLATLRNWEQGRRVPDACCQEVRWERCFRAEERRVRGLRPARTRKAAFTVAESGNSSTKSASTRTICPPASLLV